MTDEEFWRLAATTTLDSIRATCFNHIRKRHRRSKRSFCPWCQLIEVNDV